MFRVRVNSSDPKAYYKIKQPGKANVILTRSWMEFKTLPFVVKKKPWYFEVQEIADPPKFVGKKEGVGKDKKGK